MAVENYSDPARNRNAPVSPLSIDRSQPVPSYSVVKNEGTQPAVPPDARIVSAKRGTNVALSIVIGIVLVIVGLFISFFFGISTVIGFLFGIPIIVVGIAIPLLMMGVSPEAKNVRGRCPHCGKMIAVPRHLRQTECPECNAVIEIEGGRFTLPQV
ncbi:MAG TPA: hypothetical protein VFC63_05315 [Blastocatellia bacterium]|nr:hypothetical protein [Blastocatellia bacterium]